MIFFNLKLYFENRKLSAADTGPFPLLGGKMHHG